MIGELVGIADKDFTPIARPWALLVTRAREARRVDAALRVLHFRALPTQAYRYDEATSSTASTSASGDL